MPPPSDAEVVHATLDFIEQRRGQLLLHAGAAAASDGRSVVVHGASGVGKTTLTAALVQTGLAYLTDETVCVDPHTLEIEPFPKPLTVKPGAQSLLAHLAPPADQVSEGSGNWQVPASSLGGRALPDAALRPSLIVFPDVDPDRSTVDVTPVSPARAAFVLGEQSSALWAIEPRPLAAIARLVGSVPSRSRCRTATRFDAAPAIGEQLSDTAEPGPAAVSDTPEPAPLARRDRGAQPASTG